MIRRSSLADFPMLTTHEVVVSRPPVPLKLEPQPIDSSALLRPTTAPASSSARLAVHTKTTYSAPTTNFDALEIRTKTGMFFER